MFLEDDEYLLLMSYNADIHFFNYSIYVVPLEERKLLRDTGIKTSIEYPEWCACEPKQGQYNFSRIEEILSLNRGAGLKTIFSVYNYNLPSWIPGAWKATFQGGGTTNEILSFWNEEAQAQADAFYRTLVERYSAPDVMFILSEYLTGESALHNTPCFYDAAAIAHYRSCYGSSAMPNISDPTTLVWLRDSVVAHFMRRQRILQPAHNEVWDSMQWLISTQSRANGNYAQKDVLMAYRKEWPSVDIVLLQYTYLAHGQPNFIHVDDLRESTGCHVIIEAQYCEGLHYSTPEAIRRKMRGQIICPTHPFTRHTHVEPWMTEKIRASMELWKNQRPA